MSTQQQLYNGTDHVYNVDVFNELDPPHSTTDYISNVSRSIFTLLKESDPNAVWLMQGWFFLKRSWTEKLIQAWLNGEVFFVLPDYQKFDEEINTAHLSSNLSLCYL